MPGRKWGKKACQLGELAICPSAKAGLSSGGGTTTTKYKDRLSSWGKMGGRGKREGFSLWASTSPAFTCRGCNRTRRRKTRTEPSHRPPCIACCTDDTARSNCAHRIDLATAWKSRSEERRVGKECRARVSTEE